MIDRDAVPISHRSPYKRIDLSRPKRRAVITAEDIQNGEPMPDPALYTPDWHGNWHLKP